MCRYDIGVLTHCGSDIDRLCAAAKTKVHGNATVLKCLVEHFSLTGRYWLGGGRSGEEGGRGERDGGEGQRKGRKRQQHTGCSAVNQLWDCTMSLRLVGCQLVGCPARPCSNTVQLW